MLVTAVGWLVWDRANSGAASGGIVAAGDLPTGRQTAWVVRLTRLRDGPTAEGTQVLTDLRRGDQLEGDWVIGADGETPWLRTEWNGRMAYAWGRNLVDREPPAILEPMEGARMMAAGAVLRTEPNGRSAPLDTLDAPLEVQVTGDVGGGWVEIARTGGGVGYARVSDLSAASVYGPQVVFSEGSRIWEERACDAAGSDVWPCLLREMQRLGATDQALAFARQLEALGSPGWASSFEEHGPVDLVFTTYPLRANTNGAYLMVTRNGQIIEAESFDPTPGEWSSSAVMAIRRRGQDVFLMGHQGFERVSPREGGGESFIFNDVLGDCRACEPLGWIRFAFDFEANGRFAGARLLTADVGLPPDF